MHKKSPNISFIAPHLLMGSQPTDRAYRELESDGVKLIINMRIFPDGRNKTLIPTKNFRAFDAPFFPVPMRYLFRGARLALEHINNNETVFVHCRQGKHRSAMMVAAILIALGRSSDEARRIIKEGRPVANPDLFYIRQRIKQFETAWNKRDRKKQA